MSLRKGCGVVGNPKPRSLSFHGFFCRQIFVTGVGHHLFVCYGIVVISSLAVFFNLQAGLPETMSLFSKQVSDVDVLGCL